MNILLIHQAFAGPNEPGGTRHYEIAQRFVREGHRFTIVASDLSYLTGQRAAQRKGVFSRETVNGVQVLRTYTYPALHRSFIWRVVSFISFMVSSVWAALRSGPCDLVIGTSPPIFQTVSAWVVALIRRRPFLLEVRDLWPEFAIDMGVLKNPILIALSRWLEKYLYQRAKHIIVNSPAYRDYLIDKNIPENKITLIPNGVDTNQFAGANGDSLRQEYRLDGQFVVTYAGALGVANDIKTILYAAARLQRIDNIHFLIVGDGKERAHLEAEARKQGLSNVTFTGPRAKSEMPNVLATSDVCVATLQNIPMFRMTYPNKVFDYMAAGRPTVLAIDGVIRQVVEAAVGGVFVSPGDEVALADAIYDLSRDHAKAKAMGRAAKEYVGKHFDREQQAAQFMALAERLTH